MKMMANPCARCGWKYPGFHVCIDLSTPEAKKAANHVGPMKTPRVKRMPASQREMIRLSQSERWAAHHEANRERDEKIVEKYNAGGVSQPALAKEFGISQSTVQKVLKKAASDGLTRLRQQGSNIRHGDHDVLLEA